jgi:hypothetical protein
MKFLTIPVLCEVYADFDWELVNNKVTSLDEAIEMFKSYGLGENYLGIKSVLKDYKTGYLKFIDMKYFYENNFKFDEDIKKGLIYLGECERLETDAYSYKYKLYLRYYTKLAYINVQVKVPEELEEKIEVGDTAVKYYKENYQKIKHQAYAEFHRLAAKDTGDFTVVEHTEHLAMFEYPIRNSRIRRTKGVL